MSQTNSPKSDPANIIELHDVHYQIPSDDKVLDIIKACDLRVQSNEVIAIVGRSGSGKSTLLSLMAGLESATSGQVNLLGQNLNRCSEDQRASIRAQQVGFIFQNFQLMPSMTALENVLMPLELFQIEHAESKALKALEQVGLSHRANHRPAELSGGEQQRVAIARAFVTEPKILFADEPTGNLDEETAEQIQSLLLELNQTRNTTLILVTHDTDFANRCQKKYLLLNGHLIEQMDGNG
ncbi:ABC transporter ATP-binding protein [Thiomicrorhabdus immobilis]|uniref:ABC transporter ATP-binding protein n=1 Tax=Thiomicrorhabdus immobilis TaxID=2791037 RepID=A0ABM7MEA2_9GAMM|nr:ABC transporter ATP-binding protein [Thiomicrorhabdus immobilis]BCN93768.1 ABC transporter ATP-binding protein [Thiomicrorhabdus immobilis]